MRAFSNAQRIKNSILFSPNDLVHPGFNSPVAFTKSGLAVDCFAYCHWRGQECQSAVLWGNDCNHYATTEVVGSLRGSHSSIKIYIICIVYSLNS